MATSVLARPAPAFGVALPRVLAAVTVGFVAWLIVPWAAPSLASPGAGDMAAYIHAAERLQDGAPLYPLLADPDAADVYRYAPWFAFAWVPLTWLPVQLVDPLWTALLVGLGAYLLAPLWTFRDRLEAWLLAGLVGAGILQAVMIGNAQLVAVALVAFGMGRREGPLWVALGASLKPTGLAFALIYLARREYGRFAVTLALTVLLWAPALWFGVEHYPRQAFDAAGMAVMVIAGVVALAAAVRRSSHMALVAASAATLGSAGRVHAYDMTWLLTALSRGTNRR